MRRLLVIMVVLAQLAVLGFMAGKREYVRNYGERVYLRTAPIDPRDPFRGDFVRLQYALNNVGPGDWKGNIGEVADQRGESVYAVLKSGPGDVHTLDYLTDVRPGQGLFLKGRTDNSWRFGGGRGIGVKYGIEQYFVQQGAGREIEDRRGGRDDIQIPMEVEVAVGGDGTAVIRNYRWSRLGIGLEVLRAPAPLRPGEEPAAGEPRSPALRVTLKNVSESPLAIADPGQHCAFRLVATGWTQAQYRAVDRGCAQQAVRPEDLVTLGPEETYTAAIDLSEPRWHLQAVPDSVAMAGPPDEIGALAPNEQFRLVYQAPSQSERAGAAGDILWQGELPTQAFNAGGRID